MVSFQRQPFHFSCYVIFHFHLHGRNWFVQSKHVFSAVFSHFFPFHVCGKFWLVISCVVERNRTFESSRFDGRFHGASWHPLGTLRCNKGCFVFFGMFGLVFQIITISYPSKKGKVESNYIQTWHRKNWHRVEFADCVFFWGVICSTLVENSLQDSPEGKWLDLSTRKPEQHIHQTQTTRPTSHGLTYL